jgi:hypothetical protein
MNTPRPEIVIADVGKAIERANDLNTRLRQFDFDEIVRLGMQDKARRQARRRIPKPQPIASQAVDEPPTREEVLGRRKSSPRKTVETLRRDAEAGKDIRKLVREGEKLRAKRLDTERALQRQTMVATAKTDIAVALSRCKDVLSSVLPKEKSHQAILEAIGSGDVTQLDAAIYELRIAKHELKAQFEQQKAEHKPDVPGQGSETGDEAYIPFTKGVALSNGVLTRKKLEKAIDKGEPVKVRDRKPSAQRREVHIQDVLRLIDKLSADESVTENAAKMFGEYMQAYQRRQPKPNLD